MAEEEEQPEEASEEGVGSSTAPAPPEDAEGDDPTQRQRFEAGLQDTLDLTDWKMPGLRDYFWYLLVYGALIALAIYVVVRYQALWAYVLWGGYLVVLVVLASLIARSLNYRRSTYSKTFCMATLDLQRAVEDAIEEVGLGIDYVDRARGAFLRPLIAVYRLRGREWTVSLEGRSHLANKVVRVGRLAGEEEVGEGRRLCLALDDQVSFVFDRKRARTLFKEEAC